MMLSLGEQGFPCFLSVVILFYFFKTEMAKAGAPGCVKCVSPPL